MFDLKKPKIKINKQELPKLIPGFMSPTIASKGSGLSLSKDAAANHNRSRFINVS